MAIDQTGLDQQLEMARDAGLGLSENGGQFRHRQFRLGQQCQQTQTRRLPRCFQRSDGLVKRQGGRGHKTHL